MIKRVTVTSLDHDGPLLGVCVCVWPRFCSETYIFIYVLGRLQSGDHLAYWQTNRNAWTSRACLAVSWVTGDLILAAGRQVKQASVWTQQRQLVCLQVSSEHVDDRSVFLGLPNWTRRSCVHGRDQDLGTATMLAWVIGGFPVRCMSTFPINLDQLDRACGEKQGFSGDGY